MITATYSTTSTSNSLQLHQAFLHHVSGDDIYSSSAPSTLASQFLLKDRYTRSVSTETRKIDFKVLDAPTLFLLCLADIDRLKLVQDNVRIFVLLMRLVKLLKDAGYSNFKERSLKEITKFYHCQLNRLASRRFKFALKDERHFNYKILVDVMYLGNKPTLHVVDSLTAFQGAEFLRLPDILTHDAGTNFASAEFCAEAKIIGVMCKQTERYYAPLRCAWDILFAELAGTMSDKAILQIAVKAVNDTAGPNGIVPTLLRSEAIQKAITALRKLTAERQVADALDTRNRPASEDLLALVLQSEVLVQRESDGWNSPYKIASIDGHNVTVDISDPKALHTLHTPPTPPANVANKRKAYVYITKKEEADLELAIKLCNDRVITTLGAPFEASNNQEISDLVGCGVFKLKMYNKKMHSRIYIFKSRLVREVKGKTTKLMNVELRKITQAYLQAQTNLKRTILAQLPAELMSQYLEGTLLHVIKPLYRIAEAGVHYSDADAFSIVSMQTDDTLMLRTAAFASLKEKKLKKAQFRSKPKSVLTSDATLDFNGCTLTIQASKAILNLKQKGQGGKTKLVETKASNCAQQYMEQRAPEDNLNRSLRYIPVDLNNAKLIVFVDGSFANNKDLSSQLGFVLMLVNKSTDIENTFTIRSNVIHYNSTKCKRVTQSVLASKIYGMVNRFDIGIAIATTLQMITERLSLLAVPLTICTDFFSLYECLVKLETTKEKRLIIDIMALRQSEDNPAHAFTKASLNCALGRFIDSNELTVWVKG
ncbi:hypothetical protein EK21DRAFT_105605 [Setomelanomma holmii]|uniref:Integrase catalytic domain-containing protein n=1 Tax=Setomelanomma holmii TaxID=210430 RepID=A0A9P4GW01_9PLEO|nr:hypothetical protein EK21DRAFT_105605 [Setomelanomma holmii]